MRVSAEGKTKGWYEMTLRALGPHQRISKALIEPTLGVPSLPTLREDTSEIWQFLCTRLETMRVLSDADRDVLFCFAQAIRRHRIAVLALEQQGYWIRNRHGEIVQHPAVNTASEAERVILAFSRAFGLNPLSRSSYRRTIAATEPDNLASIINS